MTALELNNTEESVVNSSDELSQNNKFKIFLMVLAECIGMFDAM